MQLNVLLFGGFFLGEWWLAAFFLGLHLSVPGENQIWNLEPSSEFWNQLELQIVSFIGLENVDSRYIVHVIDRQLMIMTVIQTTYLL